MEREIIKNNCKLNLKVRMNLTMLKYVDFVSCKRVINMKENMSLI